MKKDVENWPVIAGRYKIGNPKSCVAVCTLKDIDMEVPQDKVAIYGPCNTENIGIERIIKNIISNPNIRFLIFCGDEPRGHWVGQAVKSLLQNGLEDGRRIKGAIGAMPFLKNVSDAEIEHFKKQIEIIDMIGEHDLQKIESAISECTLRDPGAFDGFVASKDTETITADYDPDKEFTADEKADQNWFVISIDRQKQQIVVEHYTGYETNSKLCCRIAGKSAASIAGTIVRKKKISGLYNAAYLGKELQKAEIALATGADYEQEKDLKL